MNDRPFIRSIIDRIVTAFPDSRVRYEFDESTQSHFVEVTPISVYESPEFQKLSFDSLSAFYKLFPGGSNLVFISENALTEIKRADIDTATANVEPDMFTLVEEAVYLNAPVFTSQDMQDAVEMHQYYCLPPLEGDFGLTVRIDPAIGRTLYVRTIGPGVVSKIHQGLVALNSLVVQPTRTEEREGETIYLGGGFSFLGLSFPTKKDKLTRKKNEQVALAS